MKRKNLFGISAILLMLIASCAARQASNSNNAARPANNSAAVTEPQPEATPPKRPAANEPAPVVQVNTDPARLAISFYEFYMDGYPTMKDNALMFTRYLTPRFYDVAEKEDTYDPFFDTQEGDEGFKDNISASEPVIKGDKATLFVVMKGKTSKWRAKLTLLKKNGTWKIDDIDQSVGFE